MGMMRNPLYDVYRDGERYKNHCGANPHSLIIPSILGHVEVWIIETILERG